MTPANVELILSKLKNVRRNGAGYAASCPAHDDAHPSLSVAQAGDGKILLNCNAGCKTEDVVRALGLEMRHLFPRAESNSSKTPQIVAAYTYQDEHGKPLYQIVRYDDKSFRARRLIERNKYAWNLENTRRVLYRLPELIARRGEIVFVTEGEKDTDNLQRIGLLATTNPHGAGKWRNEYNEFLRGRAVVILNDNDDAGRTHAAHVAQSLYRLAASVKILQLPNLPEHGDVSDWLDAGGDKEKLLSLAEQMQTYAPEAKQEQVSQPIRVFTIKDILNMETNEPNWIIKDLMPIGLTLCAGAPKIGKSWLALQIAKSITSGEYVLDEPTQRGAILYLALEDNPRRLKERTTIQNWSGELAADFMTFGMFDTEIKDLQNGGGERLQAMIEQCGYRLVVIDTLSRAIRGDQDRVRDMTHALAPLHEIAHKNNCAVLLIDHHRKPAKDKTNEDLIADIMGSTAKGAMADTIWGLYRQRNKSTARLAVTGRDIEERNLVLSMDWERGTWNVAHSADAELTEREAEIVDVLKRGKARLSEIATATGQAKQNVFTRLEKLIARGIVSRENEYYLLVAN